MGKGFFLKRTIYRLLFSFFVILSWFLVSRSSTIQKVQAASPETFTSSGTFTPATGIYAVDAACWGGGGAGGGSSNTGKVGSGGGGGAYSKAINIGVTPNSGYAVTVGVGGSSSAGAAGSNGGDSSFINSLTLLAKGGTGGKANDGGGNAAGGQASDGVGDVGKKYNGGNGGDGSGTDTAGGGGGGGGGDSGNGGNGGDAVSATPGSVGAGGTSGGGNGGLGGSSNGAGNIGTAPGGGGSGSGNKGSSNLVGGGGASGRCVVSYTDTWAPSTSQTTYSNTWSFVSAPANISSSGVGMTATTGYDYTGPINYLFTLDNTNCGANVGTGGSSGGWQASTSFTNTGLQPNQCYGYKVTARDSVGSPNTGTVSGISSTYTSANVPGTPALGSPTLNTLSLTNDANSNPSTNPTTYFAVQVVTTTPTDNTWLNKWVDASGNPSASEVWQTDSALDARALQGLTAGTTYGVKIKARNQDNDETNLSVEGQGTTQSVVVAISITTDGSVSFNYVGVGGSAVTTALQKETVSVDSGPATLKVKSTAFAAAGNTWALGASAAEDQVLWQFSKDGSSWNNFAAIDTEYPFDTNVAQGTTRDIYLRLYMPTLTNSYIAHNSTVTAVASAP